MIVLCEKCFPGWESVEVLTISPIGPCYNCGTWDKPNHAFRNDPRNFASRAIQATGARKGISMGHQENQYEF